MVLLDILFPPRCVHCRSDISTQKEMLCTNCVATIARNNAYVCPQCGARKPTLTFTCHHTPFVLAPATIYQDPIPALIHHFKYQGMLKCADVCTALVILYMTQLAMPTDNFIFTAIPMQKRKRQRRGFNQAEELAQRTAAYYNRPYFSLLEKTTAHHPNAYTTSWQQRYKNVQGSFVPIHREKVEGNNIIIVDDVCTSGATLYEAAMMLKMAGAKKIVGLVVAYTPYT
jgi:ComF family protein